MGWPEVSRTAWLPVMDRALARSLGALQAEERASCLDRFSWITDQCPQMRRIIRNDV